MVTNLYIGYLIHKTQVQQDWYSFPYPNQFTQSFFFFPEKAPRPGHKADGKQKEKTGRRHPAAHHEDDEAAQRQASPHISSAE